MVGSETSTMVKPTATQAELLIQMDILAPEHDHWWDNPFRIKPKHEHRVEDKIQFNWTFSSTLGYA